MSTKVKRLLFLTAAIALLFAASLALAPLRQMRKDYDLDSEPVEGISPQLALANQVLGWGRGLIIDVLWIRMETLKQQSKFFELVQLADWACTLAPRFPQVWDIQSWNLAYNVAAKVDSLPDRWVWVRTAIDLLRDKGIPMNPYSAMLYDRLAWIYFHKIGEQDDNAHFFYKQQFGLLMQDALGAEGDEETLKALIAAPRTRDELLKDDMVRRLNDECRKRGFDLVDGYFDYFRGTESVPAAVRAIADLPENAGALGKVAMFARARRLREEFKLEPERMLALRKQYGPFDWRSPYPHAIYWATVGLERLDELEQRTRTKFDRFGLGTLKLTEHKEGPLGDRTTVGTDETLYEFRRVTLERIIYISMQSLVRHGRLLFDTKGRLLMEAGSDYRFADATLPLFEKVIEAHGLRYQMGTRDGYMNFLRTGIMEFSLVEQEPKVKAYQYFTLLKEKFPEDVKNMSFDQYVAAQQRWFTEDMATSQVRTIITAELLNSFLALGCNADDKAALFELKARTDAQRWNEKADPTLRGTVRYDRLKEGVLTDILTGRARFPPEVLENLKTRLNERRDGLYQLIMAKLGQGQGKPLQPEEVGPEWKKEVR